MRPNPKTLGRSPKKMSPAGSYAGRAVSDARLPLTVRASLTITDHHEIANEHHK